MMRGDSARGSGDLGEVRVARHEDEMEEPVRRASPEWRRSSVRDRSGR